MSANDDIADRAVSHQINLLGFGNNVAARIVSLLNKSDADLITQVILARERLGQGSFTVERLDALLAELRRVNSETFGKINAELLAQLEQLAAAELEFQQRTITQSIPATIVTVPAAEAYTAAMARPFQGKLLREWMAGLEASRAEAVRNAIRIGYIESETTDQIVRRIRGTKAAGYADGVLEISRRNAQAIVRTAVQHTASFTSERFFEANADIIKGFKYSAVLDTRTTLICASRSGKFFAIGKPRPAIPAHIGCRSHYAPVTKSFKELGLDTDEFSTSTQASMDGQVPADITYQDWLSRQSVARQNEVLGETKAKLFRDGGLKLDRFVDRQGREYTIDELRKKDAEAFNKAGL